MNQEIWSILGFVAYLDLSGELQALSILPGFLFLAEQNFPPSFLSPSISQTWGLSGRPKPDRMASSNCYGISGFWRRQLNEGMDTKRTKLDRNGMF